ncbi:MAG TPA: glycosyltransferase [Chitinophagaceae bacterium]|nr:glycosyltransferase [Chitinophagaceae bacterium]
MKLLFHANRFPYPPYRGDKLKIYNLSKHLSKKHELHLITFLENEEDIKYLPELEKIFTSIHLVQLPPKKAILNTLRTSYKRGIPFQIGYFFMEEMQNKIQEILTIHKFDAVHIQHIRLAPYWKNIKDIPRILDLPDAFSLYWKRRRKNSKFIKKAFNSIEYNRLRNYEKVIKDFDLALVCSKEDLDYLKLEHNLDNLQLLPNGVNTNVFPLETHDYSINHNILFTGNMDYEPNIDAVTYFTSNIWPILKKEFPKLKFIIAGQRPNKKILELAKLKDVKVTGFVKDIANEYRNASILVAPLRYGAGTQNKVLEAMAMGVPVVSHKIGFEGLEIHQGQGVWMEADKESFINKCKELILSEELRSRTGRAGQTVIKERYNWEKISKKLEFYFKEIQN